MKLQKKLRFSDLTVVNLSGQGQGLSTVFQAQLFSYLTSNKRIRVLSFDTLVEIYINAFGDNYTPKYINITNGTELIIGDPTKISYHFRNKTSEWQHILAPKIRQRFVNTFGQLVVRGMLKVIPVIK